MGRGRFLLLDSPLLQQDSRSGTGYQFEGNQDINLPDKIINQSL